MTDAYLEGFGKQYNRPKQVAAPQKPPDAPLHRSFFYSGTDTYSIVESCRETPRYTIVPNHCEFSALLAVQNFQKAKGLCQGVVMTANKVVVDVAKEITIRILRLGVF